MDNRSSQRLFREIDVVMLITAISRASGKIHTMVIENVSKDLAVTVIDEIEL